MNRWPAPNLKSLLTFCSGFRSRRSRVLWEIANLSVKKRRLSNKILVAKSGGLWESALIICKKKMKMHFFQFSQDMDIVRVVSF